MRKNYLPTSINLRIIGACNLSCPFCYGPKHSFPPIDTTKLTELIRKLPSLGVQRVVITGGEPLLAPDILTILEELKKQNIQILLNTNGTLLEKHINEVSRLVDWIALPIDSDNKSNNTLMRPGTALSPEEIMYLVSKIRSNYYKVKIRIGTVITLINKDFIIGIPDFFSEKNKPDIWKLYQFIPSSYGLLNQSFLDLPQEIFLELTKNILQKSQALGIKAEIQDVLTRNKGYVFLEPNGDAMITLNDEEKIVGNFFNDLERVVWACSTMLDYSVIKKKSKTFL